MERIRSVSETPWLDALVLLESTAGRDRSDLLACLPDPAMTLLSGADEKRYREAVARRSGGLPVAYITGRREFRGVDFEVGPGVLVPRPETEFLVEETVERIERISRRKHGRNPPETSPVRYHDCCTGSGCVAISVVLECLSAGITVLPGFSDIEEGALAWARCNADRLTPKSVPWEILSGPWLTPLSHPVDVISANPPYLTDRETEGILALGWDEPRAAFQGGEDGLAAYRSLIPQARESLSRGGILLLECGAGQAEAVRALCVGAGFRHTETRKDYAGHDRVVIAEVEDG